MDVHLPLELVQFVDNCGHFTSSRIAKVWISAVVIDGDSNLHVVAKVNSFRHSPLTGWPSWAEDQSRSTQPCESTKRREMAKPLTIFCKNRVETKVHCFNTPFAETQDLTVCWVTPCRVIQMPEQRLCELGNGVSNIFPFSLWFLLCEYVLGD